MVLLSPTPGIVPLMIPGAANGDTPPLPCNRAMTEGFPCEMLPSVISQPIWVDEQRIGNTNAPPGRTSPRVQELVFAANSSLTPGIAPLEEREGERGPRARLGGPTHPTGRCAY